MEIAKRLAAKGAGIILNDLNPVLADHAAEQVRRDGGLCFPVAGDVASQSTAWRVVEESTRRFGRLDMAVANAGVTLFGSFWDYPPDQFRRVLEVNLGGSFFLAQAAARRMREQKLGGRILLMSSVTGHQAYKDLATYGMTKAALEMMAKALVVELSAHKITINALAPGATMTERTAEDPNYERAWSKLTPLGRPATIADIAHAALFLLSDEAAHITGQTLVVDGGWTCVSPTP